MDLQRSYYIYQQPQLRLSSDPILPHCCSDASRGSPHLVIAMFEAYDAVLLWWHSWHQLHNSNWTKGFVVMICYTKLNSVRTKRFRTESLAKFNELGLDSWRIWRTTRYFDIRTRAGEHRYT